MIFRRRKLTDQIPELKPYYEEFRGSSARRWLRRLLYGLAAIAVVVLLAWLGRGIYNRIKRDEPPTVRPTPASTAAKVPAQPSKESSASKPPTAQNKKSGGANQAKPSPPAPGPGALPNNGPGEVVALFAFSSLAAAGLHHVVVSLRRAGRL